MTRLFRWLAGLSVLVALIAAGLVPATPARAQDLPPTAY
jgi:hypothetical protein